MSAWYIASRDFTLPVCVSPALVTSNRVPGSGPIGGRHLAGGIQSGKAVARTRFGEPALEAARQPVAGAAGRSAPRRAQCWRAAAPDCETNLGVGRRVTQTDWPVANVQAGSEFADLARCYARVRSASGRIPPGTRQLVEQLRMFPQANHRRRPPTPSKEA